MLLGLDEIATVGNCGHGSYNKSQADCHLFQKSLINKMFMRHLPPHLMIISVAALMHSFQSEFEVS